MEFNLRDDEIMGSEKTFLKRRENGLMLSDNDIEILKSSGIDYKKYHNLQELIFAITDILDEEDNEMLDELNRRLGEYNYYNYTNK